MSDHRDPDLRHLDDEALSRYLDAAGEEPTPDLAGWEAHLADCRRCAQRLRALDDARGAVVQAPVETVDELTRRRMVATALASASAPETTGTLGAAGRAPADPWWRRRSSQVLAAAAAVLVVVGGVSVLVDQDDESSLATAEERRDALAGAGGAELTGDVYVGELGDLSESDTIRLALGEHEERHSAASQAEAPEAAAGNSAGADAGGSADDTADDTSDREAQATDPESLESQDADPAPAGDADREDVERCLGQIDAGEDSPLALAGTGVFEGEDAVVLVFRTGAGGRALAMILAASDCSILEAQSFD